MKRWALRVCLFLLLGAIVNVAVAWGCIRVPVHPGPDTDFSRDANSIWSCCRPADWPTEPDRGGRYRDIGFDMLWSVYEARDSTGSYIVMDNAYGFPVTSLRCRIWMVQGDGGMDLVRDDTAFVIGTEQEVEALPLAPLWPGFAINTLFYAGILWGGLLVFAAPFALRRRRRIKRGLCPACAYPVGASDICTECGKPVQPKSNKAGSVIAVSSP